MLRIAGHHEVVVAGQKLLSVAQVLGLAAHDVGVGTTERAPGESEAGPTRSYYGDVVADLRVVLV